MTEERRELIVSDILETTKYNERVHNILVPVKVLETYTDNRQIKKVQLYRNIAFFTPEEKEMVDKYSDVFSKSGNEWMWCLIVGAAYHVEDGWIIATLSESVLIVDLFDGECCVFRIYQDPKNPNKHNLVSIADSSEVSGIEWATVDVAYSDGSFDKATEIYNTMIAKQKNIHKRIEDNDSDKPRYLLS